METIIDVLDCVYWVIIIFPCILIFLFFVSLIIISVIVDTMGWVEKPHQKQIDFLENKANNKLTLPLKTQIKVLKHAIKIAKRNEGYDVYLIISQSISKCTGVPFYKALLEFDSYIPLFNKTNIGLITTTICAYRNEFWLPKIRILIFKTLLKEVRKRRVREIVDKIFKLKQK